METLKELSIRIHYDWSNKCRTCKFWTGDRREVMNGVCENDKSDLYTLQTTTDGHCKEWDTYDYETALEIIDGKWNHIHNPNALRLRK